MDITPTGPESPVARRQSAAPASPALQSDYETFLGMLTVQMRNQDPLDPMSASDFAVQLATFSGVEQQTQTNRLLEALISRAGLGEIGSWVGMDVAVAGEGWFDGESISLAPVIPHDADNATLVVRDAMGGVVDRRDLPVDADQYIWDGQNSDGQTLSAGRYLFTVESRRGDQINDPTPVTTYQRVDEARLQDGQVLLVLPGGLLINADDVLGLRAPRTPGTG